jgi:hypothetical protein
MDSYKAELISQKEKNGIMFRLVGDELYEKKANIHGTCIKFFTDSEEFAGMWENNFRHMLDEIRPHGRVFAIGDPSKKFSVLYEPSSKTVIIKNCDYYGWVKSIALALVADFFEDFTSEHRRYSIHGSFVDYGGHGIGIIGPSGSGKTTLTYGLLLGKEYNFLTDDWFFVRMLANDVLTFSSEKNSYIREDLARVWPQLKLKLNNLKMDAKGRAVVDIKRIFGGDRIRERSTLKLIVLLTREKGKAAIQKLSAEEALEFMLKNDFCNPHQLIRSKAKVKERAGFFSELFSRVPVYLLNTVETPQESLERIKGLVNKSSR